MSLFYRQAPGEARRGQGTCSRLHSSSRQNTLNPGCPIPEFMLLITLPSWPFCRRGKFYFTPLPSVTLTGRRPGTRWRWSAERPCIQRGERSEKWRHKEGLPGGGGPKGVRSGALQVSKAKGKRTLRAMAEARGGSREGEAGRRADFECPGETLVHA